MQPDPSSEEQTAPVLSVREEWLLFCWMAKHPRAILEDTTTSAGHGTGPHASRRAPLAYAVGLAVGTAWVLLKRAL